MLARTPFALLLLVMSCDTAPYAVAPPAEHDIGGGTQRLGSTTGLASITIHPPVAFITEIGDSVRFEALLRDDTGAIIPNPKIRWTVAHPTIAFASGGGMVWSKAPGYAVLLADWEEKVWGAAAVVVRVPHESTYPFQCDGGPAQRILYEPGDTVHIEFVTPDSTTRKMASWLTRYEITVNSSGDTISHQSSGSSDWRQLLDQTEVSTLSPSRTWEGHYAPSTVWNMNGCDAIVVGALEGSTVRQDDPDRRSMTFTFNTDQAWPAAPNVTVADSMVAVPLGESRSGLWFEHDDTMTVTVAHYRSADPLTTGKQQGGYYPIYKVINPPGPVYIPGWDPGGSRPPRFNNNVYRYKGKDIRFLLAPAESSSAASTVVTTSLSGCVTTEEGPHGSTFECVHTDVVPVSGWLAAAREGRLTRLLAR